MKTFCSTLKNLRDVCPKKMPKRPDTPMKLRRSFVNETSSFASPIARRRAGPLFASMRQMQSRPIPRTKRSCDRQRPVPSKFARIRSAISRMMPTIVATIVVVLLLPPLVAPSSLAPTMDFVRNSHFVTESRLRHSTSATHAGPWGIGARTAPLQKEQTTPVPESTPSPGDRSDCVDDKYLLCNFNEQLFVQKQYFCSLQFECKGVKDNLKNHIFFWRSRLDASSFVLDTIEKGYVIPFIDHPLSMYKGNNRSALSNAEFVNEAANE